jgi:xanthine dehydrogenase YagR molybdenum-binding subunit
VGTGSGFAVFSSWHGLRAGNQPPTAESQVRAASCGAIGAAPREASEVNLRYGGFLNADFGEHVVPVNADVGEIEVGVAPAISNAVQHATGGRLRDLPIRIEHLL